MYKRTANIFFIVWHCNITTEWNTEHTSHFKQLDLNYLTTEMTELYRYMHY